MYLSQLIVATSPEDEYEEHPNHRGEHQATQNQIALAQYECFQRMVKESHRKTKTIGEKMMSKSSRGFIFFLMLLFCITLCVLLLWAGPECNRTWDGWLCWEETEAGVTAEQNCPDYYDDFDPHGKYISHHEFCQTCSIVLTIAFLFMLNLNLYFLSTVQAFKVCTETGEWGRHPESNRTWTDFTNCKANPPHHGKVRTDKDERIKDSIKSHPGSWRCVIFVCSQTAMTHFYLVMIGQGLSLVSLLISLGIFFHFK